LTDASRVQSLTFWYFWNSTGCLSWAYQINRIGRVILHILQHIGRNFLAGCKNFYNA